MRKIGLTTSEEMSFENVDRRTDDERTTDGRTTDTFIYYKLTNEPSANLDLVNAKVYTHFGKILSIGSQDFLAEMKW